MKHKAIPDKQNTIKLKHEQKNKKQTNKHTKTIKLLKMSTQNNTKQTNKHT